ncbi:MAG: Gfo/Idh/MocA family oxidoreductase, partial [Sedimentisphaerales bacterium]
MMTRNHKKNSNTAGRCACEKQDGFSRRDFMKHSGFALAGTLLASRASIAVNTAPRKIRIGVVGGGFGCSFQWREHPDCIVQAVSDLREDRRKRLMNVYKCNKAYNSLEELVLAKDIDAVAVFTDGPLHVRHTVEAMKNGKHVISAVPAAWATVEQAELLLDTVKKYGLTYMMAETGHYQQSTISARKFFEQGKFGALYYSEAEYQHAGLEGLYFFNGKRTWRYGVAPMHYPTHCTSQLVGVTGERLTEVVCHGWGDDDPILKDNAYANPFWNESAMFRTNRGNAFRVNIWWKGAHRGCERA